MEVIDACPLDWLLFWKMKMLQILFTFLMILGRARRFSTLKEEFDFVSRMPEVFY
jgi:hypothetical protein